MVNLYYKQEQPYYKRGKIFQSGATFAANRASLCYYKVEQELLQSGVVLVLESGTTLLKNELSITKWENYYKVDQCKIMLGSQP